MSVEPVTIADWSGSLAAAVGIVFLFRKSLAYWYWSIVAQALWFYVFLVTDSLMVAGLQVFYTLFAVYGIVRWRIEGRGGDVPRRLEHVGAGIAFAIFGATIAISEFGGWPSYVELAAVALAILANWLTALKVIWCWPVWISTNVLFGALFWHHELWGLFAMQWVYAGLSVVGFYAWRRDRSLVPAVA